MYYFKFNLWCTVREKLFSIYWNSVRLILIIIIVVVINIENLQRNAVILCKTFKNGLERNQSYDA